jgi:hypothetical protein
MSEQVLYILSWVHALIKYPNSFRQVLRKFGVAPYNVVALAATEDIPQANVLSGDLIIFDLEKKPQPGDTCIGPIGERFFLLKAASKTLDEEVTSYETAQ